MKEGLDGLILPVLLILSALNLFFFKKCLFPMDVEQPKALVELTDLATLALKFILQNIHTPD